MIFDFYNKFGALNSAVVFDAFEQGLIAQGHTVTKHSKNGDVAVIWSVLWSGRMRENQSIWNYYRKQNKPVIVLEIGGLVRETTWKIGINGINQGSYFVPNGQDDTRKNQLGLNFKPWKNNGNEILICTQHDKSQQWEGNPPLKDWTTNIINEIRKYSQRPIKIRSHPRCVFYPNVYDTRIIKSTERTIEREFNTAWAVVNYSSNPGIESILNGIPAFVSNKSLASPVGNLDFKNIENPDRPERTQWLNDLAWTEWTTDEMAKGIPQKLLVPYLQFSNITGS
jgi:hypothetical protein